MKQLLKALDAGFTAFCNELWLPTFGFHLFDDPADALEEDSVRRSFSESWKPDPVDVPVELAGSLSAPGDGPEVGVTPRSASTSGQPRRGKLEDLPEWERELVDPSYVSRTSLSALELNTAASVVEEWLGQIGWDQSETPNYFKGLIRKLRDPNNATK